jgi:hypothetical protein
LTGEELPSKLREKRVHAQRDHLYEHGVAKGGIPLLQWYEILLLVVILFIAVYAQS